MGAIRRILLLMVGLVMLAGCTMVQEAPQPAATASGMGAPATEMPTAAVPESDSVLRVMTHDSFSVSDVVVADFEASCNCQVQFLKSGDTGLALNKAILSKGNPLADVLYGVDNTFMSRALEAGIFEVYASPELAAIPDELKLDPENRLLPVDVGYVTLNYDKEFFQANGLELPATLQDLTLPAYKSLLAVENPATSSPGLAFLLSTITAFGESGDYTYLDFWRDLRTNDVFVADGWEDAYYGQFSGGSGGGDRPLVVSYATSPGVEVYYADPKPADASTASITPSGQSFRQIEFVGILAGAEQPELARKWVDFMLGATFQADIPEQMWVYPAREGTPLPDVLTQYAQVPPESTQLDPQQIEAGREKWLNDWTNVVLR